MAGLLIRDIPPDIYETLKKSAAKNRRSISKEALTILETALTEDAGDYEFPEPFKGSFAISQDFLDEARKEGRA